MAEKYKNYLDFVPYISPKNTWDNSDGVVTIHMVHRGFYAKLAQKIFKKPRVSHITLDETGSFIFPLIDGKRTVGEIAVSVKEHFGEKAEPLYDRLVKYMQILYNNGFIAYREVKK